METVLRSASREVVIGPERPFCVIGERVNPTGRRVFQEELRRGDLSRVALDVAAQVAGGAMVLDVNMGAPLANEAELMVTAVSLIQGMCDLPLCLDSSIVEVLSAGLAACQGKALVNSVTAEDDRLAAILPLVKRHGAAVIALPNDGATARSTRCAPGWGCGGCPDCTATTCWPGLVLWRGCSRPSRGRTC